MILKHSRTRSILALAGLLSLVGCGSLDNFVGTYEGQVSRTDGSATSEVNEAWKISSPDEGGPAKRNHVIERTRGTETCSLQAVFEGGYQMEITSGQACEINGRSLRLGKGLVHSAADGIRIELEWHVSDPAVVAASESGELAEK